MNVLVVGGAGYVGGAVTDALLTTGHCVRIYDALLYEESYRKPVDFIFGDVRDQDRLLPQLKWADAIIWLAAIVGDGACQLNPEITIEVNQEAVGWLVRHFDRRIVFMSTCSVYGAQDNVELTEDSLTAPLSMYAASKLAAETYLRGTNAITFRLGTLFGVGDEFARVRLDLVVNTLTVQCPGKMVRLAFLAAINSDRCSMSRMLRKPPWITLRVPIQVSLTCIDRMCE